jgi:hypothetical protein
MLVVTDLTPSVCVVCLEVEFLQEVEKGQKKISLQDSFSFSLCRVSSLGKILHEKTSKESMY